MTETPSWRVAAYYAPAPGSALHALGSAWLGRDAEANRPIEQPPIPNLPAHTAAPRRYGFHATLKPPFRLAPGRSWATLEAAAEAIAARSRPVTLRLRVAELGDFLALNETEPSPALQALCDLWVEALDPFRAPPGAEEVARRRHGGLTPAQDAALLRWGYPYIFETWFFHITLTGRLDASTRAETRRAAEAHFAPALAEPVTIDHVCLFTEAPPGADLLVARRLPLGGIA